MERFLTTKDPTMNLKITIASTAIHTKSGVSSKTGKPYEIREQEAWAHFIGPDAKPQAFPTKIMLMLEAQQVPHAIGDYLLHPCSIQPGRFGSIQVKPILQPVSAALKSAA